MVTQTGAVEYAGKVYPSLSTAARAAKGGTSTNGSLAWQVEIDGRWVYLGDLRQRFFARR